MRHVYLDIETIPLPASLSQAARLARRACPKRTRDPAQWVAENLEQVWRQQSLSPLHGQVLCVAVALEDEEPQVLWGADERSTLAALNAYLHRLGPTPPTLVTHNGTSFDVPFLRKRALKHGGKHLARRLYWEKPWDAGHIDTAVLWCHPDRPRYQKGWRLDDLAEFFNIRRQNPISGADVLDRYLAGDIEAIEQHVRDDVRTLRAIFGRLV